METQTESRPDSVRIDGVSAVAEQMGLSPQEFRIFSLLLSDTIRHGCSRDGVVRLARRGSMSTGMACEAKRRLHRRGLIRVKPAVKFLAECETIWANLPEGEGGGNAN